MGRTFTLRGVLSVPDNGVNANHPILDYISPDRTRAWKIKGAFYWPKDWYNISHAADGFMCAVACLHTDTGKLNHNEITDPSDNRLCAWAQQTYNHRDAPSNFITPNSTPLGRMDFLIDEDTIVTKELYITIANATDRDENKFRDWGYLVVLEEMTITPVESIFQQIKGMAQDVLT